MLPTINLALTTTPETSIGEGSSPTLTLDGEEAGSFADLLRIPVPVTERQAAGNLLPLFGEGLPADAGTPHLDVPIRETLATEQATLLEDAEQLSLELWSSSSGGALAVPVDEALPTPVIATPLPRELRLPGDTPLASPAVGEASAAVARDVWQRESAPLVSATPLGEGSAAARLATPPAESLSTMPFSPGAADGTLERFQGSPSPATQSFPVTAVPTAVAAPSAGGNAQATLAATPPPAPMPVIEVPLGDGEWADALGQRVLLMTGQRQTSAEIRLTPAELGPLRVNIAVEDGAANVTFSAQHLPAREAIESALPRLREMLDENGVTLADANVSDQAAERREDSDARSSEGAARASERHTADERSPGDTPSERASAVGLIDTYA